MWGLKGSSLLKSAIKGSVSSWPYLVFLCLPQGKQHCLVTISVSVSDRKDEKTCQEENVNKGNDGVSEQDPIRSGHVLKGLETSESAAAYGNWFCLAHGSTGSS